MKNDICRQETVHLNNHLSSSRVWFLYILFSLISFSKWENVSPLTEIHYQVAVTVYSSGMWWLLKKGQQKQLECVMVWGWVFRKSCCPDSWECFFFFFFFKVFKSFTFWRYYLTDWHCGGPSSHHYFKRYLWHNVVQCLFWPDFLWFRFVGVGNKIVPLIPIVCVWL